MKQLFLNSSRVGRLLRGVKGFQGEVCRYFGHSKVDIGVDSVIMQTKLY